MARAKTDGRRRCRTQAVVITVEESDHCPPTKRYTTCSRHRQDSAEVCGSHVQSCIAGRSAKTSVYRLYLRPLFGMIRSEFHNVV